MLWYSQAGTPQIVANGSHDASTRIYRLDLAQSVPATPGQLTKQPMVIPLAVGLVGRNGHDLPLKLTGGGALARGVLTLTKPAETLLFTGVSEAPVLSLNRGFSAPVKLTSNLSTGDLQFLAAQDSDPFNRWQAFQTLATRFLVNQSSALRAGHRSRLDHDREALVLTDALGTLLSNATIDPAFAALMLTVPGESEIAREIGHDVDPTAIFTARTTLRGLIGSSLHSVLLDHYRRLSENGRYRFDGGQHRPACAAQHVSGLLVATERRDADRARREQ